MIADIGRLCREANLKEHRTLLLWMLGAVYFEIKATKSIVALRPKPPFKPIFRVATSKEGSGIRIVNEPPSVGSSVFVVESGEGR
jgi:site-specific DNA recombinase